MKRIGTDTGLYKKKKLAGRSFMYEKSLDGTMKRINLDFN